MLSWFGFGLVWSGLVLFCFGVVWSGVVFDFWFWFDFDPILFGPGRFRLVLVRFCAALAWFRFWFWFDFISFCICLLYTSPSPRDKRQSRMPSSA